MLSYLLPWTYYSHIIFIWFQEITLIYIIYDEQNLNKEVKRELKYSCIIWKWLHHGFSHMLNEKGNFSFFTFCIDICPIFNILLNNLRMFTSSYVNDMLWWNNININEFPPEGNNYMIEMCNMQWFLLICTKIKNIEKLEERQIFLHSKKKIQMFLKWKTLNHSCMQLTC